MKKFYSLLMLLVSTFAFVNCDDEDFEGYRDRVTDELMRYAWVSETMTDFSVYIDGYNYTSEKVTLYFLTESRGFARSNMKKVDDISGATRHEKALGVMYGMDGTTINISIAGRPNIACWLKGNALVDKLGRPIFVRRAVNDNDRDWLNDFKYSLTDDWENINVDYNARAENKVIEDMTMHTRRIYWGIFVDFTVPSREMAYTKGLESMKVTFSAEDLETGKPCVMHPTSNYSFTLGFYNDNTKSESAELYVMPDKVRVTATIIITNRFNGSKRTDTLDIGTFTKPESVKEYEKENGNTSGDGTSDPDNPDGDDNTGGNNTGSDNDGDGAHDGYLNWKAPYYYNHDGGEYKMVCVEGGDTGTFYIMQTELRPSLKIEICGKSFGPIDSNGDNIITIVEFQRLLDELRRATGYNLRLPTRDEWQYAAKGGKYSKGYTYAGGNSIVDVAWYRDNSSSGKAVASKKSNELGLYDMSGNYAEATYEMDVEDGIDGDLCGGSFKDPASSCKWNSWVAGNKSSAYFENSRIRHKGAINAKYETVRLIFTK